MSSREFLQMSINEQSKRTLIFQEEYVNSVSSCGSKGNHQPHSQLSFITPFIDRAKTSQRLTYSLKI